MNSSSGSLASVVRQVRALLWTARVELSGAFRYRASFVSDIVVYTVILTLFMMSGSGHSLSEKYGVADYRSLLFAGYIAWTFANSALVSSVNNTSAELSRGTFYRKLNACCPLPLIQLGELLSTVLMNCIVAFAVAIIGGIAWDLRLYVSGVSVGAIAMCSLGMYGMGLLLNGATIKYKRVGSLLFLFQLGLLFVTDTIPSDSIGRSCAAFRLRLKGTAKKKNRQKPVKAPLWHKRKRNGPCIISLNFCLGVRQSPFLRLCGSRHTFVQNLFGRWCADGQNRFYGKTYM